MSERERIEKAFHILSQEARELYLGAVVAETDHLVPPLIFYREYVSKNLPLLIKGGIKDWPAVGKWSVSYFRKILRNKLVTVAVTPNGYADAITEYFPPNSNESIEYFVLPEERELPMSAFLDTLENPKQDSIFYIQKQNSNFEKDFPELWPDVESNVSWANTAFGKCPDAINLWMGDERAITSMHKDPYENIYCVISGEKTFTLHPPTDLPWIPYKKYPCRTYKELSRGEWIIEPTTDASGLESLDESSNIPWISVDPLNPNCKRYPQYKLAKSLTVTVKEGDILYLPSLWFHHVTQSHACISVNYWYDMEFDIKYAYFKTLETLCHEIY